MSLRNSRKKDATKILTTILTSVSTSVLSVVMLLYFWPKLYFAKAPSEIWWTALSIIVAVCFGVIAIAVAILLREKESKDKVDSLEKTVESLEKKYKDSINYISSFLEVLNVSETKSPEIWKSIKNINGSNLLRPQTLRDWSTFAWKQGYTRITRELRERAYNLDKKDFRSRVMFCSILTPFENNYTKIENILNRTDLKLDNITDEDKDYFYNVQGAFYKKNKKFKEASESFGKSLKFNIQAWPFSEYVLTLIMREDISNEYIKKEIRKIEEDRESKWSKDTSLYQSVFRIFVNGFINKSEINKFYNCLTPLMISKLVYTYNNGYVKPMFFNFYSQITKKYNDKELNVLYLTFYQLLGVYDKQADNELRNQEILDEINKRRRC